MKPKLLMSLGSCLLALLLIEGSLRLLARRFDLDASVPSQSPFLYDRSIGYELRPHAILSFRDEGHWRFDETMNVEGFRGPDVPRQKSAGLYRVLAIGDSVVEAMTVRGSQTWEVKLQQQLNKRSSRNGRYEVLNAGIGGYVAWQAAERLRRHGLPYHPNLVIALIGWNDFVYSTLPVWKPGIELTQIQVAYAARETEHPAQGDWARFKRQLTHRCYIARMISHARGFFRTLPWERELVRRHQTASGHAFNGEALNLYQRQLEVIYRLCRDSGTRLALVTWPTILSERLLDDPEIHRRLLQTYVHFPLSTAELWRDYLRYQAVQRRFAAAHPDVLLMDLASAENALSKAERLRFFIDMAHLSAAGNAWVAQQLATQVPAQ